MRECSSLKKVIVLIGNFGSGKTELAMNMAMSAAQSGKTELIDLDMVNTYFRLTERKALLREAGIRLVSPNYAMTNVETLSLPADVSSAFDMDWDTVIFDVGGDPAGATALGRYHADFAEIGDLQVLNVVNIRRPMSGSSEKIISLMDDMQHNSRLTVTGIVNNTNLAHLTTPSELRDGYEILREVSLRTGVPVVYTSGTPDVLEPFLAEGHDKEFIGTPMEITVYMHRDWESFTKHGV